MAAMRHDDTAAEQSEAEAYAAAVGGVIEPLPTDA
jgi:hypothetical protein